MEPSMPIKLIALDLDGTLLNSDKQLSARNYAALDAAAAKGVEIVPCTGRFYGGIPEVVRKLPFLHYGITINGAAVFDFVNNKTVCREEIEKEDTYAVMTYLESLPVLFDCYLDNTAYIAQHFQDHAMDYLDDKHFLQMIWGLRIPVPDLKPYVMSREEKVQKIIMFTKDRELRQYVLEHLTEKFPNLLATSSVPQNVEINQKNANKGRAIRNLAAYLGIPVESTMAFGDGLNDVLLLEGAGFGVAMANGEEITKAKAKYVTDDNDHDGVATAIERFVL